jgi:protein TonB
MANHLRLYKKEEVDLKLKYRKIFEWSLIFSIVALIIVFYSFKNFKSEAKLVRTVDTSLLVITVPQTIQQQLKPKPLKPVIPCPDDDPDLPSELTIPETEINFNQSLEKLTAVIPPEPEEPPVPYYILTEKPTLQYQVEPYYPEMAQKASIEGMVVVRVLINTKGEVEKVEIVKSHPMLDEAAVAAARQFRFSVPKQNGRAVKVWMSIPFTFRLKK